MVKIPSASEKGHADTESCVANAGLESDFKPMTAEEVRVWRLENPSVSPWRVLWLQVVVGLVLTALTGLFSGQFHLAASVGWGALAVVIPAIVFVRALSRQMRRIQPGSAFGLLMFWELVKVVLTVALLLASPKVIANLSWLALVAGFVVTMKVYWLAMALGWMHPKSKPNIF